MTRTVKGGDCVGAAFVISRYPPALGGTERRAQRLAGELARRGLPVTVLTRLQEGAPRREESYGVSVLRLGGGENFLGNLRFYLAVFLELTLRRDSYSVIQNFLFSTLTLVCCGAGYLLRKPVFVSLGGAGMRGGLNDVTGTGRLRGLKKLILSLFRPTFITPNREGFEELLAAAVHKNRARLIYNPADPEQFSAPTPQTRAALRKKLGFDGTVFLFAGRFVQDKNLKLLAEAWDIFSRQNPSALLVLAGDGPEKPVFEKLAAEKGLQASVRLDGTRDDIADYYRAGDFFVLPSDNEGMSNALLEAMLCQMPPLVRDISGCALVEDGKNGLKAPEKASPEEFAALMARANALTAAQKTELGRAAEETVLADYTLHAIAGLYMELYLENLP